MAARRTYLVGEKGPELFTPNGSGRIVPNHRLASGGSGDFEATIRLDLAMDGRVIQQKLLKLKRSNGGATLGVA